MGACLAIASGVSSCAVSGGVAASNGVPGNGEGAAEDEAAIAPTASLETVLPSANLPSPSSLSSLPPLGRSDSVEGTVRGRGPGTTVNLDARLGGRLCSRLAPAPLEAPAAPRGVSLPLIPAADARAAPPPPMSSVREVTR